MAAQVALAVGNVESVLAEAGMSLANIVRLNIYRPMWTPSWPATASSPDGWRRPASHHPGPS
jgi:enamine deaminase RidA (YjgF/YER057c/UK114 family)